MAIPDPPKASTQLPHTWIPQVASGCSGTNRYTAEPAEGTGPLYDFSRFPPEGGVPLGP